MCRMNWKNYPVYGCPHCGKVITSNPEMPVEYLCTCFPVHGQYLPAEIEGEFVGMVLVTSDLIKQMQANAVAPQS